MGKIIVIYHSQQYGNTKILAESLAEGAREAGAEVSLINTNERRVTLEEFLEMVKMVNEEMKKKRVSNSI